MKPSITLLLTLLFTLTLTFSAKADPCYYDYMDPVAVCDAHIVVALSNTGTAKLFATDIDDGSWDNCGIVEYKARRMTQGWCPPGVADDTQFRPYVEFCCEDIGGPIWVILRVVDAHGNYNECMAEVTVQDNTSPDIICPPNITVSCCFYISDDALHNPYNRTFGTVVGNGGQRLPIIINDPCNPWYNQPHNWGLDGVAGGSCGGGNVWVSIPEVIDYRNACGVGIIKRKFYVEAGYWSDWCYQTITVKDYSSPHYNIVWPWDYTADACLYGVGDVDPDHIPPPYNKPTIPGYGYGGNSCSLIGIAHDDLVFTFNDGACKKILREWTVIDWCKYEPNNPWSQGIWKHTQVIKLMNSYPPQFTHCPDHVVVEGYEPNCKGRYHDTPHVVDDCTPTEGLVWDFKIDLWNDGSYDIWFEGEGQPYVDKVLPFGWHKILWNVGDACGNYTTCSYKLHVIDKKQPTPVCYYGLSSVVMPLGGMVTIWAKDFNASSYDNCTPAHKLKYSFSENVWEASRTFTCDDLGTNPIQIWVHDEYGNKDYCTTFIKINDNSGFCEGMHEVAGLVSTFEDVPVPQASAALFKVMPDHSLEADASESTTDAQGRFSLGFGTTQYDRMVMLEREGRPLEGISTADVIALQRHINGLEPITQPHKLYAGDLDGSGRVGANDLLLLKKALLGAYQLPTYQGNLSWVFFGGPCLPTSMDDLINHVCPDGIEVDHTGTFPTTILFRAIKMGDVNGDYIDFAGMITSRTTSTFTLYTRTDEHTGDVEILSSKDTEIYGMQLSLQVNGLDIREGALPVSSSNLSVDKEGTTHISWGQANSLIVKEGEVLFSISNLPKGLDLNDMIDWNENSLYPEIYRDGLKNELIEFIPYSVSSASQTFESKVSPNPFSVTTRLEVTIPSGTEFSVSLYDIKGQELFAGKYLSISPKTEIAIDEDMIHAPGIYFYRVKSSIGELSGKFIKH